VPIDLSASNAAAFPPAAGIVHHPCPQGGHGTPPPTRERVQGRERSGDIRAWTKEAGIAVSERGRIPASVVAQYETAAQRS